MSITYATKCNVSSEPLDVELVDTSVGGCLIGSHFCMSCVIEIESQKLEADLTFLNLKDFDFVLGMDWLDTHYASLDCREKKVLRDLRLEDIQIVEEFPDVFQKTSLEFHLIETSNSQLNKFQEWARFLRHRIGWL
ncbi:hypothetical protein LIER_24860 [Lithospermum erythrorhizon]|uniref:Uncharacterized protein n=1 Tax=Lithospermum erythrorhizon TaxID=34254 RepID=A0AAV3R8J2_LITER